MPKFYDSIQDDHKEWGMKQAIFFIASAPSHGRHINISPKGLPTSSFAILSPTQCAYVDATGSGCETISHLRENGRATIMFCSFGPAPRIMRFFCTGHVVEWDQQAERTALLKKMEVPALVGARAVLVFDVFKTQTSCGFGVPYLSLGQDPKEPGKQVPMLADRDTLGHWAGKVVEKGQMAEYQAEWNKDSLDGLPGLKMGRRVKGENLLLGDLRASAKGSVRALWHVAGATVLVALLSSATTMMVLWQLGFLRLE